MTYEYKCPGCGFKTDIVKPVALYDTVEICSQCGTAMTRAFAPKALYLNNTQVQEIEKQPAFGKPMTKRKAEAEAKARGWVGVGNEKAAVDKMAPSLKEYDA